MVFTTTDNVRELVVRILAGEPGLRAQEIHQRVLASSRKCTPQAIFKELKRLQQEMIVVRVRQRYSLNLTWAMNMADLCRVVEQNYLEPNLVPQFVPPPRARARWNFSDLLKLRSFWADALLALARQTRAPVLLSWNPHAWTYLLELRQGSQFLRALQLNSTQMFKIIGGSTFLDKTFSDFWKHHLVTYSFAESPFHGECEEYLNVIDDYVITVSLDRRTADRIESIYGNSSSQQRPGTEEVDGLFRARARGTITVERSPKKAESVYRKFRQYFGFRTPRRAEATAVH